MYRGAANQQQFSGKATRLAALVLTASQDLS